MSSDIRIWEYAHTHWKKVDLIKIKISKLNAENAQGNMKLKRFYFFFEFEWHEWFFVRFHDFPMTFSEWRKIENVEVICHGDNPSNG